MIENDYMMRIIHEMVRMWLKLLFNIDEVKEEEIIFEDLDSQQLYQKLRLMAEDGQINEAENLLYEHLQSAGQQRLSATARGRRQHKPGRYHSSPQVSASSP